MDTKQLAKQIKLKDIIADTELWVFDYHFDEEYMKRPPRYIPPQRVQIIYPASGDYQHIRFRLISKRGKLLNRIYNANNAQFFSVEEECKHEFATTCIENIRKFEALENEAQKSFQIRINQIKDRLRTDVKS